MTQPAREELEEPDDRPDAFESVLAPLPAAPAPGEFAEIGLDDSQKNQCVRCGNSCRSVYLWQGDLRYFKENDTKKWVEYHEIETFTSRLPDGRLFWGVKIPKPCKFLVIAEDGKAGCA